MRRAHRLLIVPAALALATGAVAQPAPAPAPPSSTAPADAAVLTRSLLEATRANTEALGRIGTVIETFSNRLERLEAAARGVPPAMEGVRTDIVAIRAGLDRLVAGQRRAPATLKFATFACGNDAEPACAQNACRSVGYARGIAIAVTRTGTGAGQRPVFVEEATCYD